MKYDDRGSERKSKTGSAGTLARLIIGGVAVLVVLGVIGSFIDDESEPPPTTSSPPTQTAASFSLRGFANGRYLEQQDPQLASAIRNLGWVQDGIGERAVLAVSGLMTCSLKTDPVIMRVLWDDHTCSL